MSVTAFEGVLLEKRTVGFFHEDLAWRFIARHYFCGFDGLEFFSHAADGALNAFLEHKPAAAVSSRDEISDGRVDRGLKDGRFLWFHSVGA